MTASVGLALEEMVVNVLIWMSAPKEHTLAISLWRNVRTQKGHFHVDVIKVTMAMALSVMTLMSVRKREHQETYSWVIVTMMQRAPTLWAVIRVLVTLAFRAMVSIVRMWMNAKTLHWSIMFVMKTHTATTQWDLSSVNVMVTWDSSEMEIFVKVSHSRNPCKKVCTCNSFLSLYFWLASLQRAFWDPMHSLQWPVRWNFNEYLGSCCFRASNSFASPSTIVSSFEPSLGKENTTNGRLLGVGLGSSRPPAVNHCSPDGG